MRYPAAWKALGVRINPDGYLFAAAGGKVPLARVFYRSKAGATSPGGMPTDQEWYAVHLNFGLESQAHGREKLLLTGGEVGPFQSKTQAVAAVLVAAGLAPMCDMGSEHDAGGPKADRCTKPARWRLGVHCGWFHACDEHRKEVDAAEGDGDDPDKWEQVG
jgi:hypothetical protein